MKKHWIITTVLVVIVGAAGFFGGMQYQKMQRPSFGQNGAFFVQGGGAGGRRFGNGQFGSNARPVRGEIISSDSNSITVKLQDGSSKIVLLGSNTSIMQSTSAGKDALQTGKQVMVFGNQNSDGSVTAQFIQLNPEQMQIRMTPQPTQ